MTPELAWGLKVRVLLFGQSIANWFFTLIGADLIVNLLAFSICFFSHSECNDVRYIIIYTKGKDGSLALIYRKAFVMECAQLSILVRKCLKFFYIMRCAGLRIIICCAFDLFILFYK